MIRTRASISVFLSSLSDHSVSSFVPMANGRAPLLCSQNYMEVICDRSLTASEKELLSYV